MLGVLLLPLIALGLFQGIIACLLLAPLPVARPVLSLSKATRTPIAWTIIGTVSVVLLVFLLASLYELGELHSHTSREGGELDALHRRHSGTSAWLSAVLTSANLLLVFVLQKLASVLSDREQMRVSQGALLKQVQGIHAEYERLRLESDGGGKGSKSTGDSELAALRESVQKAEKSKQDMEAQVQQAIKLRRTAESNVEALKSQTKGLENEYDRLLSENDSLKRRLAQLDPALATSGSKKGM